MKAFKMVRITTAVLPVAGLGTRVLPLTLHQPKSMISVVDRPMIHYIIDEIVSAGITHIVIVTGPRQKEFKKYTEYLAKDAEWKKRGVRFDFAVQKKPYGNGDAIYAARKYVGKEPFLVCFSDDILADTVSPASTLLGLYQKFKKPVITLEPVPKTDVSKYGVVKATKEAATKDLYLVKDVVEKPKAAEAPSNLTIIGRYVLNEDIMREIGALYPYRNKEIGLADALKNYALKGNSMYGWHFRGSRFDGGSKIGILKAQAYFGLHHKEMGAEFKKFLKSRLKGR